MFKRARIHRRCIPLSRQGIPATGRHRMEKRRGARSTATEWIGLCWAFSGRACLRKWPRSLPRRQVDPELYRESESSDTKCWCDWLVIWRKLIGGHDGAVRRTIPRLEVVCELGI